MKRQAVVNVTETKNLQELAEYLVGDGWELFSTGKTASVLSDGGISCTAENGLVESPDTIPEYVSLIKSIMTTGHDQEDDGSVGIRKIPLICINLTPDFRPIRDFMELEVSANCIDERNSSVVQAAAKNYQNVIILTDPDDYREAIIRLKTDSFTHDFRLYLAGKAFNMISAYNAAVSGSILLQIKPDTYPKYFTMPYCKITDLHQGANSQQTSAVYRISNHLGATSCYKKLQGNQLTYQLVLDINATWKQICSFSNFLKNPHPVESRNSDGAVFTTQFTPAAGTVFTIAIKYTIPIGAALGSNVTESCCKTVSRNAISFSGAVLGCSAVIDETAAQIIAKINLQAVIAPGYTAEARVILAGCSDLRLTTAARQILNNYDFVSLDGGVLIQSCDNILFDKWNIVTKIRPTQRQADEMAFGMLIVMAVKSEATVIIRDMAVIELSSGQIQAAQPCIQAYIQTSETLTGQTEHSDVLVCDSVLQFTDYVRNAAEHGIKAIIQTGGAPDEAEFIKFCDEHAIAMICTGIQHIVI
jgi:phosphoribosylaminoimidazolecarboxamide formyltransferase / IMP cyclohydrolase